MKKIFVLVLALAMGLMMASFAIAADQTAADSNTTFPDTAGTGINNTVHDLGSNHDGINYIASPVDPLARICIFCHAPHNTIRPSDAPGGSGPLANAAFTYLPLWNHQLTAQVSGWTMYTNSQAGGNGAPQIGDKASQAILNGMGQPGSVSLLCLSCHDGTVAVNAYGNTDQPTASRSNIANVLGGIAAGYVIGKDQYLGNHHPIGFDYDAVVLDDTQIRDADTAMFNTNNPVRDHLFAGTGGANTVMECATCHAVHNTGNTGESLLYRSDTNSRFCLTCHIKGANPVGTYDTEAAGYIQ